MLNVIFHDSGNLLKKIVDIVKENVNEAILVATPEGMSLQNMDDAHIALIDLTIDESAADSYECDDYHNLSINFSEFHKIINKTKGNRGVLILNYDENKAPDILKITFQGDKRKSTVQLKLKDIGNKDEISIPEMDHKVQIKVDVDELQKIFSDLSMFSESVMITRTKKKLIFSSVGDSANSQIEMDLYENYNGSLSSTYSLKYLMWFTKSSTLSSEAILYLDDKFPILLHFQEDTFSMKFFMAAKYNENETPTELEDEEDEGHEMEY